MTTGFIRLPLEELNTNRKKRVGDRKGWPIQRDLSSQGLDLKLEIKRS